jgi:hypothetical protein
MICISIFVTYIGTVLNIQTKGRKVSDHLYLAQTVRGTHSMLVSLKGATRMLSTLPFRAPIDHQVPSFGDCSWFVTCPFCRSTLQLG